MEMARAKETTGHKERRFRNDGSKPHAAPKVQAGAGNGG